MLSVRRSRLSPILIFIAAAIGLAAIASPMQADPPADPGVTAPAPDTRTPGPKQTPAPPKLPPLSPPTLHCASAILVDAASGQVLYEKNADVKRPMASTTKIMTALLFCELVPDDAMITASPVACSVRDSSLHLKPGERLRAHDLLRAILMRSANDGCVAAAEYAAGSEAAFVDRMNARAARLGATRTHFANPHGLNDRTHYSTARDLATIGRAAMLQPRIEEVVRTEKCRIDRSIDKKDVTMRNHSHFLGHFPGADGVKTGWTIPAGHCYVGSATINGWRLISVVLKSEHYVTDTTELMKFGFRNFTPQTIARPGDTVAMCPVIGGAFPNVPATVAQTVQFITRKAAHPHIEKQTSLNPAAAPVATGAQLGFLQVMCNGSPAATAPLVSAAAVPAMSVLGSVKRSSPWGGVAAMTTIFAVGLVSLRYGTRYRSRIAAFAKGARRRRRRVAQKLRGVDR